MGKNGINSGFLTTTDKEFLRGEKEYTGENAKQQRYQRRRSIVDRARNAYRDFALLAECLPSHERNKIFKIDDPEENQELQQDLSKTVEFMYRGLEYESLFRRVLKDGVRPAAVDALPPVAQETPTTIRFEVEHGDPTTETVAPLFEQ